MYFFDYGNAFLLEARRAGADVSKKGQVRACTSWSSLQQPAEVLWLHWFSTGWGLTIIPLPKLCARHHGRYILSGLWTIQVTKWWSLKSQENFEDHHHHLRRHHVDQRWVCTSGRPEDLATTDRLAKEVLEQQVVVEQDNDDNDQSILLWSYWWFQGLKPCQNVNKQKPTTTKKTGARGRAKRNWTTDQW